MSSIESTARRKDPCSKDPRGTAVIEWTLIVILNTFQAQHPYTEEVQQARAGTTTYKEAFQAIYDRRHAFSSAYPFSARVVGYGNKFLYLQGTLCVLNGNTAQISGVHPRSDPVQLNLTDLIRPILDTVDFNVDLLYYSEDILAVKVTRDTRRDVGYIFAIDTAAQPGNSRRVIKAVPIPSCSKLFVRHTARYLYYGTHTGLGDDGHHKWEINGFSLNKSFELPERERPLLLEDFHGTDIGSTVAFEIHNDYFYAVSNQGTFEVEEIDYTSFYHTIRFPIDNPIRDAMEINDRLYRRQHKQGPIHDSWTDLTLQLDERTNETVIVESRREWAQASSRQSRTFYVTKLDLNKKALPDEDTTDEDNDGAPLLPDDILNTLLSSSDKPHYMPTPPQHSASQHAEFSPLDTSPRSFILARTKFRAYNYSSTSYLDIVEDERCCPDPTDPNKPPCLRLRIGSRREYVPDTPAIDLDILDKGKQRATPLTTNTTSTTTITAQQSPDHEFVDSKRYKYAPTRMWPPPSNRCPCAKRLHDIVCPVLPAAGGSGGARSVVGVLDDRSLVYMVKAGRSYGTGSSEKVGAIVVVEFSRPVGVGTMGLGEAEAGGASAMGGADAVADGGAGVSLEAWDWTPGLERRCRAGMCH
ncbi:hypothetical protein NX059_001127 [Plenodomus lindquistii]|nr:hypothetical protein NX059_001127 [Plenodomus lindquistii]